ncbi:DedD protein [Natronocella acetinitrilica]|uniref:DedD protein n=1 Tax=Natronocella acetinitrilica TaxID=414046 RepID=A0AAE3KA34_9GAMM|nr:SPOR domain-containing protein [Natronocella acetinitrilica]MCP1673715.1 DedD protein [Natronocella acetinitrilica]
MQQRHKQRLVGAVVVIALAVIFLPMLLRGPVEHRSLDVPVEVPPRPAAETVTRTEPRPGDAPPPVLDRIPVPDSAPEQAQEAPQADDAVPAPDIPAAEDVPSRPPAEGRAYAVQVGSFRSRDNAIALRDRLRNAGYPAYVEETQSGESSTVYRLRVGPVAEREEARALSARLADQENLEGIIVSNP